MNKTDTLKIVAISDLHFGHPKQNNHDTLEDLYHELFPKLEDAHVLFICGDIYDTAENVGSPANIAVTTFIRKLVEVSVHTGLQIRILHGTYSHDRDQVKILEKLRIPKSRFGVINEIFCEEMHDFRSGVDEHPNRLLRVGYLPDNLGDMTAKEALEHLHQRMDIRGWANLDIIIGHGSFEHVFKEGVMKPSNVYTITDFNDILSNPRNNPIIFGHIHTPGRTANMYYCGSFERLSHGEEEAKGYYIFTNKLNDSAWISKFIVNEHAVPFKTIIIDSLDPAAATKEFKTKIENAFTNPCSERGHVRVICGDPLIRSQLHKICAREYPALVYTSKAVVNDHSNIITTINADELEQIETVDLNRTNITSQAINYLKSCTILSDEESVELTSKINNILKEIYHE